MSAGLHVLACCMIVTLIELVKSAGHLNRHELDEHDSVSIASAEAAMQAMQERFHVLYGFSYMLAWCSWMISFISGIAFLAGSRKKKMLSFDDDHILK